MLRLPGATVLRQNGRHVWPPHWYRPVPCNPGSCRLRWQRRSAGAHSYSNRNPHGDAGTEQHGNADAAEHSYTAADSHDHSPAHEYGDATSDSDDHSSADEYGDAN